ncbi:hypothetical protein [Tautonia plasticadhaerens]|uniref:Uncharacterized protein n=1 Tax=Tautonia plasticadhaerens TaxID=2527974 RepID=A0A518HEW5_9BACT|nr:hypothetical protein [Tautonia plasticadhaerens]QDV39372.1 hypothetical protein ElP_73380 [Tautonia plasticadhaerens]
MTPGGDQRIAAIFEAARGCDPAGRAALLDGLCGGDAALRAAVERLLADDARASRDHFLTTADPRGREADAERPSPMRLRGLEVHLICPHCRNPIELVGLPAEAEVLCPACGSTFRLERESTASWSPRGGQRLDRFELIEAVGSGAFGTVYRARDPGYRPDCCENML